MDDNLWRECGLCDCLDALELPGEGVKRALGIGSAPLSVDLDTIALIRGDVPPISRVGCCVTDGLEVPVFSVVVIAYAEIAAGGGRVVVGYNPRKLVVFDCLREGFALECAMDTFQ